MMRLRRIPSLSRWLGHLAGALALAFCSALPGVAGEKVYQFGVVPQYEPRKLIEIWAPILEELSKRTGYQFLMAGAPYIPDFEAEFKEGRYDFAYMNPYHAYVANQGQKYEPILRDGGQKLAGILVVKKDGPIQTPKDLNGKNIAFPAPNSLGASLLMRSDLDQQFKIKFQPLWVQTHTSSYLNVVLGKADAAGGVMATLSQQPQSVQDKLRIIHETRSLPTHPIVVHPRVPTEVKEKVRLALLEMGNTPASTALLAKIPMPRPVAATMDDYRELGKRGLNKYYVKGSD